MSNLDNCSTIGGQIIVLQEKETKLYVDNDTNQKIIKIQIDGCLVTKANLNKRCDWLLLLLTNKTNTAIDTEIYIELKGSRISDAVEQLEATLNNLSIKSIVQKKYKDTSLSKIVCCIIYNHPPNDKRDLGILKEKFKRNHPKIILKILPKNSSKRPQKLSQLIS